MVSARRRLARLLLLCCVFLCSGVVVAEGTEPKFNGGCFRENTADVAKVTERNFEGPMFASKDMSRASCDSFCASYGKPLYGLAAGAQCWCGRGDDFLQRTKSKYCNLKCAGDGAACGGPDLLNVYSVTEPLATRSGTVPVEDRPLLALAIMVKDEAHTIGKTLSALVDTGAVDVYYILDTGSTDNTIPTIKHALKGQPFFIYQEPFVDYSTSRNRLLDIIEAQPVPPLFNLILSADETLENPDSLRAHCLKFRDHSKQHGGYRVVMQMKSGMQFESLRVMRVDANWRYTGKVHEYLAAPLGKALAHNEKRGPRVPDFLIQFAATDKARRRERDWSILEVLKKEVRANPKNGRSLFYLAQTYEQLKEYELALEYYIKRKKLEGWHEELYHTNMGIARSQKRLNYNVSAVRESYLTAYEGSGNRRAEPLVELARLEYEMGHLFVARLYIVAACEIPIPETPLWLDVYVYDFQRWQLAAIIFGASMEPVRGLVAVQEALKTEPHDPEMLQIQKILQNLDRLHFALAGTQNKGKASSALANVSLPPLEGELSLPVVLLLLVSGLLLLVVATYAFQKLELRLGFQSLKSNGKSV